MSVSPKFIYTLEEVEAPGGADMAQSVKEGYEIGSPAPTRKSQVYQHRHVIPVLERQRQKPVACLAKSECPKFNEKPCFKREGGKRLREAAEDSSQVTH